MKRFLICAIAAFSLFAIATEAQAQSVQGSVTYEVANGQRFPAPGFLMKFCRLNNNNTPPIGQCTNTFTFADGTYGTGLSAGDYYVFIWRHDISWGSENYPFALARVFAVPFQIINFVGVPPRALPPNAVNPANNSVNRPDSFTLQWTDGLDANRRNNSKWPVTYDIYASGNEFPENLVFQDIPCNGVGTCAINVSGLVFSTRYQWRVVAKIRSLGFWQGFGDNALPTSSATFRFSTMFDPSTPTYSFRTNNGRYLTAPGGGGGDFTATATGIDSLTSQFKIIDVNGGDLISGDAVHIQTNRNYYLMAFNGGGGDVATSGWAMSWETFYIVKTTGSGQISGGQTVALIGPNRLHYLVAEGGGGGTVNCNRTALGPFETFTLVQQ